MKRFFTISFIAFAVYLGLIMFISIEHPIILKWTIGTARCIGTPVDANIFGDDSLLTSSKLYRVNRYWNGAEADSYILIINNDKSFGGRNILSINKQYNYVGLPIASGKENGFDEILGVLFQSETGANYANIRHPLKGFDFDPQLNFNKNSIHFNLPRRNEFVYNSIKVDLSHRKGAKLKIQRESTCFNRF